MINAAIQERILHWFNHESLQRSLSKNKSKCDANLVEWILYVCSEKWFQSLLKTNDGHPRVDIHETRNNSNQSPQHKITVVYSLI